MKGIQYLSSLKEWNGRSGFSRDKVVPILELLGSPQEKFAAVHIAGTNGKGSVSAMCAAALAASGERVGLTTSPHLSSPNERIVINGCPISDEALDELICKIKELCDSKLISLSFFELLVCAAFYAFAEAGVSYGVVEVGLGGRHDATNVMSRPAATAVVTIDIDHQEILGASRYLIAREKAAIARDGVPMILGALDRDSLRGVEEETRSRSPLIRWGHEYVATKTGEGRGEFLWHEALERVPFAVPLKGNHQIHNAAVSLAIMRSLGVDLRRAAEGIAGAFWPGRIEEFPLGCGRVLLDAAHNVAGMRALRAALPSTRPIRLCLGVVADKEWRAMVKVIAPVVGEWWLFNPRSPRALPAEELAGYLSSSEINVPSSQIRFYGDRIDRGVEDLRIAALDGRTTVVAGSIFLMGAFRDGFSSGEIRFWPPAIAQSDSVVGRGDEQRSF